MKTCFNLALAQVESVPFDTEKNLAKAEEFISAASDKGAEAVLFPEMFITGYRVRDRLSELAEPLSGPIVQALANLAHRYRLLVVCGLPESSPDKRPYNSACIIDADGTVLGAYHKTHLFGHEPLAFAAGEEIKIFQTTLGTIGVMICYDAEFPEVARVLALKGSQMILVPTANMDPYSQYQAVYLRARAMENGVYVACSNTIGNDGTFRYFGQSTVVDPEGRVLGLCGSREELLLVEIDLNRVPPKDKNLHVTV